MKKKNEYKHSEKPMLYIAYGSNINLTQMAFRCPHSKVIGTAMVKGWELEFRGVATIVPKQNTEVPVLLWELDPRDIPVGGFCFRCTLMKSVQKSSMSSQQRSGLKY